MPAWFSFGAPVLNGNKRSAEACARLPLERLLAETDAPWQPPKGSDFCRFEDIAAVTAGMAALRGLEAEELDARLERNFRQAFRVRETMP